MGDYDASTGGGGLLQEVCLRRTGAQEVGEHIRGCTSGI